MARKSRSRRWCAWILRRKWSTTATAEFCLTCCGSWRCSSGAGGTLKPTAFYLRYGRSATYQDLSGGHFLEGRFGGPWDGSTSIEQRRLTVWLSNPSTV